jgi:hypothetical protein
MTLEKPMGKITRKATHTKSENPPLIISVILQIDSLLLVKQGQQQMALGAAESCLEALIKIKMA